MPGTGPAPKDPDKRVRRNRDPVAGRTVPLVRSGAPDLPGDLLPAGIDWHPQTRRWWEAWVRSPLSRDFTEVEWQEMLATAVIHHRFFSTFDHRLAAELRQRVAKFGATSEDRARLRIVMADADAKDEGKATRPTAARTRYANVRAMTIPGEPTEATG